MRSWLAFALLSLFFFPSLARAEEDLEEQARTIIALRSERVADVLFLGDNLSESVRSKFLALRGRDFNPSAVRSILLWYHENGGDAFLQVKASRSGGGMVMHVHVKQRLKIAKVEFEGNQTNPASTLLQQIELKEGYDFEPETAKIAAAKISLFYSKQGYLASDVRFTFDSTKRELRFVISEGEPTLLAGIGISPLASVERRDLRERYEREIRQAFGLKPGDRIQRDRVLDGIQAVKDWLRDHDFLMARDPSLEYKVSEDGKVSLFLDIAYGPRIRYGFRGNMEFSYRELMVLVGEVKEVSTGSDYLSAVRRRVLDAYKEIGFANAKITTLVREDSARGIRYVSLIVSEGEKVRIEGVSIEGVFSLSYDDARQRFQNLGTRLVQRDYFDETGITRGAELFAEQLRASGYLSARLEFTKFDFDQQHKKVKVSLLFSEGIQTKVAKVEVVGVKGFQPSEVLGMFGLKEGEPFNIFAFEKGLQALKDKYQEIGNLSAQITNEASDSIVRYSKDNSEVFIRVEVDEGPVFRVGEVIVRGNKKTHARVVLRELPIISGDLLTAPLLSESEDNLRKLNLFSSVIVRPIDHPGAEDMKDVLILVEESEPGSFDIVPGFRNDLGLRLGFELGYQNLGGWNRNVNASAVFNRRLQDYYGREDNDYKRLEYKFSIGFREPYLANWPVVFTSNLNFQRRQYKYFDANVRRVTTGVKRELTRYLSGFMEYGYEQVEIDHVSAKGGYDPATDARTDFIGSVTPGLIIDSRNDPFSPSKGLYSVNRFEIASRFFGSETDVGYARTTSFSSAYFRVYESIVFALAVNFGWERSNVARKPIPPFKLFRMGGLGSIRGYTEDGIEVESTKNIFGSLGMINYRGEFRIPVKGNFGTALFLDAGNLMVDRLSFSPTSLRSSVGTGFRYNTPVGPVLLDFAWRLQTNPKVGDTCVTSISTTDRKCQNQPTDRYKVHFAIGVF